MLCSSNIFHYWKWFILDLDPTKAKRASYVPQFYIAPWATKYNTPVPIHWSTDDGILTFSYSSFQFRNDFRQHPNTQMDGGLKLSHLFVTFLKAGLGWAGLGHIEAPPGFKNPGLYQHKPTQAP